MLVRPYVSRLKKLVAHPTASSYRGLRWIGAEPQAWGMGLMNSTIFVGLDVHKATVSVAVAEGLRGGEVRHLGTFPKRADQIAKFAQRLAKRERGG